MTDAKYIIISQYMSEIQPHMDKMKEVLMLSKHQFIIDESGIRKVSYNDENKYILVYDPGYGQLVVIWSEFYSCWITVFGRKLTHPPTHWQELPEDPK